MYTLNDKNREQNVCKINMCLRVENCCHKNGQNFPVDLIYMVKVATLLVKSSMKTHGRKLSSIQKPQREFY